MIINTFIIGLNTTLLYNRHIVVHALYHRKVFENLMMFFCFFALERTCCIC